MSVSQCYYRLHVYPDVHIYPMRITCDIFFERMKPALTDT